ncbi:hypothetical protein ESCO_005414 [Escovopsis weberi]|uniref:Myb-like domain-containing protein n=1 Tax=Escovopsis weberi TaxID=150374 RepID=A0A0M9VV23_ESCWE|nr:hypothetical protein ESCO_005414 [Escovopsis weberi]
MNKNWNDKADKDLFFTILSVKNIGVISGAEWTTIGNHMRTLGYGFTNEGCRQHFQGLRRAQNKHEVANNSSLESARRADPTLNPITRRPGPGRGRPKKIVAALPDAAPLPPPGMASMGPAAPGAVPMPGVPVASAGILAAAPSSVVPGQMPPVPMPAPRPSQNQNQNQGQMPNQVAPSAAIKAALINGAHYHHHPPQKAQPPPPPPELQQPPAQAAMSVDVGAGAGVGVGVGGAQVMQTPARGSSDAGEVTPGDQLQLEHAQHGGGEMSEQHPAKRQRIEAQDIHPSLALDDEEAVLALAAHNEPDAADAYPADLNYGEA